MQNREMLLPKTESITVSVQCALVALLFAAVSVFFLRPELRTEVLHLKSDWLSAALKQPAPVNTPASTSVALKTSREKANNQNPPPAEDATENQLVTHYPPPPLTFMPPVCEQPKGKPIRFEKVSAAGVPLYKTTIDLHDPETFLVVSLANKAEKANDADVSHGDESFASFVKRSHAAMLMNGTFFSKDSQKRVMGNLVSEGVVRKFSQWEDYGTTLGIKKGNEPEMVTARTDGKPDWNQHWLSITCGPRLLRDGATDINPELEGFKDPHVLGVGSRCAIGFNSQKDELYLVTFLRGLSLSKEAEVMKSVGCSDAMNLDGGASRALFYRNSIVVEPSRALTNVIVVYDSIHKAPPSVVSEWKAFQRH